MDSQLVPAVLYAAKSTQDVRGSIPTQLADCRSAAEAESREVVAEHRDEAASAFKGNRGAGLTAAKNDAIRLGAELWVQHSDRLARGDGITADHLAEVWFALRRHGVRLRSVQDDSNLEDAIRVVLIGERNYEDSKRKGAAVAAGQRRRFESGKRLGSKIRDGYRLELVEVDRRGRPVHELVHDPDRAPVWRRIFDMVESGHTPGAVRAALNGEGVRMKSGAPWTTRAIRRGVLDNFYAGRAHAYGQTIEGDHEPLIDPERWERIAALVHAQNACKSPPSARTRARYDWLLRGIANCGRCGAPLYTRADRRTYVCKAVREGHGTCGAAPIPAEQAEQLVLDHLDGFVGGVEQWLAELARTNCDERDQFAKSLDQQRRELQKLDLRAERAHHAADRLLDEDDEETAAAMVRKAEAIVRDRDQLAEAIAAGGQRLADWPTAPNVDAALDSYNELRDAVQGRRSGSQTVSDLRARLRATLAEARLDYDGASLFGTFFLRVSDPTEHAVVVLGNGPVLDPIVIPSRETSDTTS
jgi:Recombinase/Resolvase, N terminal domain/Recombinase zinc beta ribbon domain